MREGSKQNEQIAQHHADEQALGDALERHGIVIDEARLAHIAEAMPDLHTLRALLGEPDEKPPLPLVPLVPLVP